VKRFSVRKMITYVVMFRKLGGRWKLRIAAAAVAAVVATLAHAAPAHADVWTDIGNGPYCYSGYMCFWSRWNFVDHPSYTKQGSIATNQNIPNFGRMCITREECGFSMQDVTSSWVNATNSTWCLYSDNWYSGLRFRVAAWEWWANIPDWFNDKLSSARWGEC